MILFKPEHVKPILDGRKTQTRRLGKRRWNIGAHHQARTRMMDKASTFAVLEIGAVGFEPLQLMTPYDAWAEGYECLADFVGVWERINGPGSWDLDPMVYVVCFRIIGVRKR